VWREAWAAFYYNDVTNIVVQSWYSLNARSVKVGFPAKTVDLFTKCSRKDAKKKRKEELSSSLRLCVFA
jgi:hypothetical protein